VSVWRKQINLIIQPPDILKAIQAEFNSVNWLNNMGLIRINPYPPSFKSTPAKIIEPLTGASTWALGSHKWTMYIGIFTKKAPTPAR
jgi:hypothetical protein